ncbi:hypothetical protein V6N11_064711 [Hibiscus sabdariffa]|uniref:Uncharacterized protein n=1 Tax=Hibiscus sabdariffa TaxID=183260 RepID=A0ABR2NBR2_9ROSI
MPPPIQCFKHCVSPRVSRSLSLQHHRDASAHSMLLALRFSNGVEKLVSATPSICLRPFNTYDIAFLQGVEKRTQQKTTFGITFLQGHGDLYSIHRIN